MFETTFDEFLKLKGEFPLQIPVSIYEPNFMTDLKTKIDAFYNIYKKQQPLNDFITEITKHFLHLIKYIKQNQNRYKETIEEKEILEGFDENTFDTFISVIESWVDNPGSENITILNNIKHNSEANIKDNEQLSNIFYILQYILNHNFFLILNKILNITLEAEKTQEAAYIQEIKLYLDDVKKEYYSVVEANQEELGGFGIGMNDKIYAINEYRDRRINLQNKTTTINSILSTYINLPTFIKYIKNPESCKQTTDVETTCPLFYFIDNKYLHESSSDDSDSDEENLHGFAKSQPTTTSGATLTLAPVGSVVHNEELPGFGETEA